MGKMFTVNSLPVLLVAFIYKWGRAAPPHFCLTISSVILISNYIINLATAVLTVAHPGVLTST